MNNDIKVGKIVQIGEKTISLINSLGSIYEIEIKSNREEVAFSVNIEQLKKNSLTVGDIIKHTKKGRIYKLFSSNSLDNVIFVTDHCNNNCIMCSQPPNNSSDSVYFLAFKS